MQVLTDRGKVGSNHSFIGTMVGQQGSGKSYAAITLAAILDPNITVDNIYFDYRDLIQNRKNLKSGCAVIVDEQSEEFGVDSNRINIILGALKEQLRKKSIHFIFCSPTLKPEYQSSMYVLETMFIDYEQKASYAAYMTRDLLTLGYVMIPHPLNFVTQEFLDAYEKKKDAHLDKLTGVKQEDEIEEWAEKISTNEIFVRAEEFYVKKVGYMPASMVMQVINKLYPEFKSSVIVMEIAARVKLNKELEGRWKIPYAEKKKKK
jgi:ABC-type dipeptide/oligopeptide/nickel transport system ATPase component